MAIPDKPKLVGAQTPAEGAGDAPAFAPVAEPRASYIALLILTAGALYVAYIVYRPFLKALFLALVLSIAFWPLDRWIARRVRGGTTRAIITTLVVLLVIMLPLMLISFRLFSEAASLYGFITQKVGGNWSGHFAWLNEAVDRIAEQTGISPAQLKSTITARVQGLGSWLVGFAGWAARGFAQQVGTAILTLLIMFFFLRDRERYTRSLVQTLPISQDRALHLASTLRDTVVSNLYGMVAVGLIQGSLTAIGWWMTGLRAPFLWGAMATIFSFVPLVGPSLIWWPGVFVLAAQGRWIQAAVLLAWGMIVVSGADYIVRPRFAGGRANANTLLVLLSLLGGLKAFGAVGIIAGPVVLSLVTALLTMVREERAAMHQVRESQNLAA
ncbi:MAG TPA: AI-2E family transporter [Candidatus Angelobacter sp.]